MRNTSPMGKEYFVIVLAAALIAAGIAAYLSLPKEQGVIKIGHIAPFTGDAAIYGEWERQGIELAVEEINAKGGIKGMQIRVLHEDDQLDPKTGVSALNKLINFDKVSAVIGAPASSVTLAIAPIAEKNKVVLVSAGSAAIKISYSGDYIFRVFPSNAVEGKKLVELAAGLGIREGAILYINNDFGSELYKVVNEGFATAGGIISASEGYEVGATDFRTQLTKVQAKRAKGVFILGYPKDMALLMKQAIEIGINATFLAPDTFNNPDIVEWSGNATEGVIFVFPSEGTPERWQAFNKKIKDRYGKDANIITAMAYDAMNVIAVAIEKQGISGESIKNGLYGIKDYPGVTGDITFDRNGDVVYRPLSVRMVKGGKFVDYLKPPLS